MSLLQATEGVNRFKVLSFLAEKKLSSSSEARQKEIVEGTTLSKGAVSNNCNKLLENELLEKEESSYQIYTTKLLELYREHLEANLGRQTVEGLYQERIEARNSVCTDLKRNKTEVFTSELNQVLEEVILNVLANSSDKSNVQTLREAFLKVDQLVILLAEDTEVDGLEKLAVVLDDKYGFLPDSENKFWKEKRFTDKLAEEHAEKVNK